MKKYIISLIMILFASISFIYAQEAEEKSSEQLDEKTGFPVITDKPFVMFDEGLSISHITRLETMEDRSNFVHRTDLVGAYVAMQTVNIQPCDALTRIAVYYPTYNSFNGMKQKSKQMFLYAVDFFWGPCFRTDMWKYIKIDFAIGPHVMYQLTDEYHMIYAGGAAVWGLGLPVSKKWTAVADGTITVDYANFGSNRNIQNFDYEWQYQISLGVRYSKKGLNKYSYINSRVK